MKKIGLTGGIGSGKTTVAKIFEALGIPVYYADTQAKRLLNQDYSVKEQIIKEFGNIYVKNLIDRKRLAEIVFTDSMKLQKLNSIVHPAVKNDFENWCLKQKNYRYIVQEAAILFESGMYKNFDKIITIYTPETIRIQRVCDRDNVERKKVLERIRNQIDDKTRKELSDFVVNNYANNMLIPQILSIHKELSDI